MAIPGTNPAANDFPLKSESVPVAVGSPRPGCTPLFDAAEVGVQVPGPVYDAPPVDVGVDCDTVVGAIRATHCAFLQL